MGNLKSKLRGGGADSTNTTTESSRGGVPSSSNKSSGDDDTVIDIKTVRLQHQGNCSGMFWRGDPRTNASPPTNSNWPRNGALLKGTGPHIINNTAYFKVTAIQQAGKKAFKPVPDGTWMLYEQQGNLLFDV